MARGRGLQLVVEQALVQGSRCTRTRDRRSPRERLPRTLDRPWRIRIVVRVRSFSISWTSRSGITSLLEAGVLVHAEGSGHAVAGVHGAGCEQVAAVGGHRQIRVMRPFPDEREESQDARPRAEAAREFAASGGGAFEPFEQSVQAVASRDTAGCRAAAGRATPRTGSPPSASPPGRRRGRCRVGWRRTSP